MHERKYQTINFIENVAVENNNEIELQNSKWDQNFGNMAVYVVFISKWSCHCLLDPKNLEALLQGELTLPVVKRKLLHNSN